MDKLCKYIDKELEEIEDKAGMSGKLSGAELEYADKLAHLKKSLLTNAAMSDYSEEGMSNRSGRSYNRSYNEGGSYDSYASRGRGRNARRDSRGRYSSEYSRGKEELTEQLYELMEQAPDEHTRKEFERFIQKMEQ